MEVPRLGVESELQLPAYTTATARPDPSRICGLPRSLWQHWILNPLSEARVRTLIFVDMSQVLNPLSPQWELLHVCFLGSVLASVLRGVIKQEESARAVFCNLLLALDPAFLPSIPMSEMGPVPESLLRAAES